MLLTAKAYYATYAANSFVVFTKTRAKLKILCENIKICNNIHCSLFQQKVFNRKMQKKKKIK